ncbi:hypothetical protein ACI68E_001029 [Malassezia pachydermatis]
MAQFVTGAAKHFAGKRFEEFAGRFEPQDPYYEYYMENGQKKRRRRQVPPGLTKQEEKILRKIKRRAHYLDKGFRVCGLRFGWTFLIGLIPFVGDAVDALLSYNLIVKKAKQIDDIPKELVNRMVANNVVSAGVGMIPLVGDVILASYKTNSRNANLLEDYLRKRAERRGTSAPVSSVATGAMPAPGAHVGATSEAPAVPPRPH